MKVGDLVKLSEEYYPEYKGLFGVITEKKAPSGLSLDPMWKVFIQNRMHSFYIPSQDIEVVGYDEGKMTGGRL